VALLGKHGDGAKMLSGGQSLLPLLKLRLGQVDHLVDIGRIPGLDYLREEGGSVHIGALVREARSSTSDIVAPEYPILLDTARVIADPIVRNRATVCGNLAHGDPGNDHPATMLALGAQVVAQDPRASGPSRSPTSSPGCSPPRWPPTRSSSRSASRRRRPGAAAPTSSSSARSATTPPPRPPRR
jgi:CO/xanthine dehydrogenase FAD-binding subunit